MPVSLALDDANADDPAAYPITVEMRHLGKEDIKTSQINAHRVEGDRTVPVEIPVDGDRDLVVKVDSRAGTTEKVRAKYLIACEGSHSWTRRQLGFVMEGESKDEYWGVIDVLPINDFPEKCQHSRFEVCG